MTSNKIFTIGGATFDVFVQADDQSIFSLQTPEHCQKWLAFPHGSKVPIKAVMETFGGGATNTAVTFAAMGCDTYFVGMVGKQYGERVFKNLSEKGVHCDHARQTDEDRTGFSNIINTFDGDRTLLYYPGANRYFTVDDLPLNALKETDWIFLSHMAKSKSQIPLKILEVLQAHSHIKLAWNPGREQIEEGVGDWSALLAHTEVLFLNKEEAAKFTGVDFKLARSKGDDPNYYQEKNTFLPPYADDSRHGMENLIKKGVKNVVITDGKNGAQASDEANYYYCPVTTQKRVDVLGAGDAFASACTSALMKGLPLKTALIYGTINAGSVVNYPGAQNGVLTAAAMQAQMKEYALVVNQVSHSTQITN